jgi:putative acetyltransferase
LQAGVFTVTPAEYPHVVEVCETPVWAMHHFITEADFAPFKPLVRDALPHLDALRYVRSDDGEIAGFIGVEGSKVEMLFIHPLWYGQSGRKRLLQYVLTTPGATELDVNEQSDPALGFYRQLGFDFVGRSGCDSIGKPYPLLHMSAGNWRASRM